MDNPSEVGRPGLDRNQVLDAIDKEITHRESVLSRHGITTWGVTAVTGALLWTATNEALSKTHDWTNVLLVLLAGGWLLEFLASPLFKTFGIGNASGASVHNLQQLIRLFGIEAHSILSLISHTILLLIIAIYLGSKGFLLLSVTAATFYTITLMVLGFCWLVHHVQLPLIVPSRLLKPKDVKGSRILVIVIAAVTVDAVWSIWPLEASDARLGLMLAGLSWLWSLSIIVIKPPTTTDSLRYIRSRLAFQEVSVEEAKAKALFMIRGAPEEYLTAKAEEVASEQREYIDSCSFVQDQMNQIIIQAEKLRASNSERIIIGETVSEFRALHRSLTSGFRDMDYRMRAATELRRQFLNRLETARFFLRMKSEFRAAIVKQLDDLDRKMQIERQKLHSRNEQFIPALDFLYEAQKGIKLPPKLKLSEGYEAVFKP